MNLTDLTSDDLKRILKLRQQIENLALRGI